MLRLEKMKRLLKNIRHAREIKRYLRHGRRPWDEGYVEYKAEFLKTVLSDQRYLSAFREGRPLPGNYGERLDERVVEYPWILSRIADHSGTLLDAGSTLNRDEIITNRKLANKSITIMTLAPDGKCFCQSGISYLYHDLRDIPVKDEYFDTVICISTLEHIGMDNTRLYIDSPKYRERKCNDYCIVVSELKRVLKKGGELFVTVPYGKPEQFGWFQVFDAGMVEKAIIAFGAAEYEKCFYRYSAGGWEIADEKECSDAAYFDIFKTKYYTPGSMLDYDSDFAAAARAVACLRMVK